MKINFLMLMVVANDYMFAVEGFKREHDKFNGKKPYWYKENDHLEYLHNSMEKYGEALWSVSMVTGIPQRVLINAVRIERKYEKQHKWERCLFHDSLGDPGDPRRERLIESLMAKTPEDLSGIYKNEYFEAANHRIEVERAFQNKLSWWAEYEARR